MIHGLELGVEFAVEKNEKPKSCGFERLPLASPMIRVFSRRIVQPVANVRKCSTKRRKIVIAGIIVAIKTKIR